MSASVQQTIEHNRLIPVIKLNKVADAIPLANALVAGGLPVAEITLRTDCALDGIRRMRDLDVAAQAYRRRHQRRMRVATKYMNLTRGFFANYGINDYRIVESLGATEGTPAAGTADLIVDITSTGSTLKANALRVLDDGIVLRSEANLVASKSISWTPGTRAIENEFLTLLALD